MQWVMKALTAALSFGGPLYDDPVHQSQSQEATVFALIYGYPLLHYVTLAESITQKLHKFETNTFYHQPEPASASFTDINRPNVDTLYSEALVDVSSSDLIVKLPHVEDGRFYVFPFYDLYGNNVVNLGTQRRSVQGSYRVTYRPSKPGYEEGHGSKDPYAGHIYLPTPYGAIDLRIEINSTNPADVDEVKALQSLFLLEAVRNPYALAPPLTARILLEGFDSDPIIHLLQLTARLSQFNLPEVATDIARVKSTLQIAGLARGFYRTPSGVNLTAAQQKAEALVSDVRGPNSNAFCPLGDGTSGWTHLCTDLSGDFKSHYTVRAFVAAQGYLQLKAEQAVYPVYKVSQTYYSSDSYTITFKGGKPKVTGFWSLTVYNSDVLLVDNGWKKYALGDRSYFLDVKGNTVYGDGATAPDDTTPFVFLLQSVDNPPPQAGCLNWLPTPSGNSTFSFNIRWYGPTEELLHDYEYPVVEKLKQTVPGGDTPCTPPLSSNTF